MGEVGWMDRWGQSDRWEDRQEGGGGSIGKGSTVLSGLGTPACDRAHPKTNLGAGDEG